MGIPIGPPSQRPAPKSACTAWVVPMLATILTIVTFSSIGVPGTNGFVGEFLSLIGSFRTHPIMSLIATTSVIIAAAYLLWAIQRIIFNPLDKPENAHIPDLNLASSRCSRRSLRASCGLAFIRRPCCSACRRRPSISWQLCRRGLVRDVSPLCRRPNQ